MFNFTVKHLLRKVMTNSILEITEDEYLIKLNRTKFDLSFIRSLLKIVEVANPTDNQMITSDRHIASRQSRSSEPDYYGSLEEK